ncbi:MAG: hypothetical protein CME62_16240 [Halobacteriovoraceae bacterium]|nr:hypothetical protein [Halobacteriovoraceae bacterium]|tara:strand:+ start:1483 stop:2145 length:663 start_codon:yes stop_codon:yes gene_type:complete
MSLNRFLLLLLLSSYALALDFTPGAGSKFVMKTEGQAVDLSIYVASRTSDSLNVEMHFGAGGIIPINMWQQFQFKLAGNNQPLEVSKGYIKTTDLKNPEVLTKEFFKSNNGVQVQDFLFASESEIAKDFIAEETIEVPAGSVKAKHFRKSNKGQTVDFWIAENVGPIGLVKLVSKSEKNKQANYEIELKTLLKNVAASIKPSQAVPMSSDTRKMLGKSQK